MIIEQQYYNGYWIQTLNIAEEWKFRIIDDCTKEYIYTS